jgi:hypothetical protein
VLGTYTQASYGRCENVRLKRELVGQASSPKLAVIAGSSAVRGINAGILSQVTGRTTVNFGLFAGIGPDIVLYEARRILKPGDTALLALEYNHYVSEGPSADALDYVLRCGRDYFRALPLLEKLQYVFGLPLSRVYESLVSQVYESFAPGPRVAATGGDRSSITALGDIKLIRKAFPPLSQEERTRMSLYRPMPIAMNRGSQGARMIEDFVVWAKERKIEVIATWPNTIYFPEYAHASGFDDIRSFYADLGVEMVGDEAGSLLPLSMFYNTQYHLGIEGIGIRSRRLASDLQRFFAAKEGRNMSAVNR